MKLEEAISTIMTTSINSVEPNQPILSVKHLYEKAKFHSHIPVVENGILVGIISLINFMRAINDATLEDSEKVYNTVLVKEIMTPNPDFVTPNTTIKEVVEILAKGNYHSLIVATDGNVNGIVTTTDIIKQLLK